MESNLRALLMQDFKTAFKSGDKVKKMVVSQINAAIKNDEVNSRTDGRNGVITEADILGLIRREIKQTEESLSEAKGANREDLAAEAETTLVALRVYLPKQLSREAVTEIARAVIAEVGATTIKDNGAVMKAIQPKVKDIADGKLVSEVVRGLLA